MDRRELLLGGAALGTTLTGAELLAPQPAEAAAFRLQQGEFTIPGVGVVNLTFGILGTAVTGSIAGALNGFVEGLFQRNQLVARIVAPNLTVEIATLTGQSGRRNTIGGTLRLNGVDVPFTTNRTTVNTNFRRLAGNYEGDFRNADSGELLGEHVTTVTRTGIVTIDFRLRGVAGAGGPSPQGAVPGVRTNLVGYVARFGRATGLGVVPSETTAADLAAADQSEALAVASLLIAFARGGTPVQGSTPDDCTFLGSPLTGLVSLFFTLRQDLRRE